ncbi:uncharacterized protein LOC129586768 [Paramacrobiotus metropolitanus]|uniref:uncharacterized protein LOC129586768 n=1 Tax=Paramacrobiotus metropolitanus TaxID=2943436 RepID=UPI00244632D0|nr:uncharacterized protein LOC129586768 [Paramacrobiotus metropolitanus]
MSVSKALRQHKQARKEIFSEWRKRMFELDTVVQQHLDARYSDNAYRREFRFCNGADVIAISKGVYYEASIVHVYRARPFPNVSAPLTKADVANATVPTYIIHYRGWSDNHNDEHAENDLLSRRVDSAESVHSMLFAHEWNTLFRTEKSLEETEVGLGSWFLPDESYANLERTWQSLTETTMSFAEYSGRAKAEKALLELGDVY